MADRTPMRDHGASGVHILAVLWLLMGVPGVAAGQNLAPTLAPISNEFVVANSVFPVPVVVGDDGPLGALTLTATSDNQALVADTALSFSGSGAERTLTVAVNSDPSRVARITVVVSDGNQTAQRSFIVLVQGPQTFSSYFAEGATGSFFSTDIAVANPHYATVTFTATFYRDDGTSLVRTFTMPPRSRTTVHVADVAGLQASAVSTQIDSPVPLFAQRTMFWDASGYGASLENPSVPDKVFYFAEGAQGFFHTYFLLQNPTPYVSRVYFTFMMEDGPPVFHDYPVPPNSRVTIDAAGIPELVDRSFGAIAYFDVPGVAERAMYFGTSPLFSGGSVSVGAHAPSVRGDLVDGATGPYFDTFVLLANDNLETATATLTYRPVGGTAVTRTHTILPRRRLTINIGEEDPSLQNTAVSTQVDSDRTLVIERAQYWPHGDWQESHVSHAIRDPWNRWVLPEGRVGGRNNAQTYILVQNPTATPVVVDASFLRADGTTLVKHFTVNSTSRFTIAVTGRPDSSVPELTDDFFSTIIESATTGVSVEQTLYFDANGVAWAAGANASGQPYPRTIVAGAAVVQPR